ncbi:unnamed protein product [Prorocentrum cordatum]|uniref:Uncharacterized protein n=1 Tax=Prorocentrum cordatum TaxID=2364126 RepID=A0ABN9V5S3_9DINO|nr:unnamed protein product [Polarella glacialis]
MRGPRRGLMPPGSALGGSPRGPTSGTAEAEGDEEQTPGLVEDRRRAARSSSRRSSEGSSPCAAGLALPRRAGAPSKPRRRAGGSRARRAARPEPSGHACGHPQEKQQKTGRAETERRRRT